MASCIPFILLLLLSKACHCLKCMEKVRVHFTSSQLSLSEVETVLHRLQRVDSAMCEMRLEFDFVARTLSVRFDPSMDGTRLDAVNNVYIHSVTTIAADKRHSRPSVGLVVNVICFSNDECDRQFLLKHFDELANTDQRQLELIARPLLAVRDEGKALCTVGSDKQVKACSSNACSWYQSTRTTKSSEGKCEQASLHVLPTVQITTEIKLFERRQEQDDNGDRPTSRAIFDFQTSIQFWCSLNNCNSPRTAKRIEKNTAQNYHLWADYDVCQTKHE